MNINIRRTTKNIVAIVSQVLASGVVLFVLYRYLYDRLGVEQIGVWSMVLATTSISRIGDLGLSAGVVRYVAKSLGQGDIQRAADVIQTVALTLAIFMATLLTLGHPLFCMALSYFIPAHGVPFALSILPYALVSLWVMVIVGTFSGGLDGCLRMDLRSLLMVLSHFVYLGLTILLVPKYGLEGVAMAQLIQSVGLMIMMWWMLRRELKVLPLIPLHWKFPVLKEMIIYGLNFQIITIMNMLFDPIVKALMSKFGGLGALGYYEMANKLILQGRALIVEASRVIVPTIAMLQERTVDRSNQLFMTSYIMTFYISVLFYGLLGISITSISIFWIGYYQPIFIQFALLLNVAWFTNTLITPVYFSNLGTGKLMPNMIAHAIIGLFTPIIGWVLGVHYGGLGVVIGSSVSLAMGSIFLHVFYINSVGLKWWRFIVPKDMYALLIFSVSSIIVSNYGKNSQSALVSIFGMASLSICILLIIGWLNPTRNVLLRRMK